MTTNILLFCLLSVFILFLIVIFIVKGVVDKFFKSEKERNVVINLSLGISFLLILFSFFAPYFFTSTKIGKSIVTTQEIGYIGDTMGGTMTPFIAIAATILTFLAFWVQYKSNIETKEQFNKQNEDQLFFRLTDNLQNRIINYKTGSENTFDFDTKSESYNTLKVLVNTLKNSMELNLSKFGRHLLVKLPEVIDELYYSRMQVLDQLLNPENFKQILIDEKNNNERWELLKLYFNSAGNESDEQIKILKAIGSVYFYKTDLKHRKQYYEEAYEKTYTNHRVFLDGYLKNLEYILNFILKSKYNKEFYIDFLSNNLTSYEKGIIFYYLASSRVTLSLKNNILIPSLLEDLYLNNDYFVDVPSFDEYQKELKDIINYNEE